MANSTRFGLAATLITGDPDRAERVSARLSAGTVWVNCFFVRDLGAPFGGKWQIRDRSRGRDLFLRLLHRHQEHRVLARRAGPRTGNACTHNSAWTYRERKMIMGEVVGAGLIAHVPTIVLPEDIRRELNNGRRHHARCRPPPAAQGSIRNPRLRHRRRLGLSLGDDGRVRGHRAGTAQRPVHLRGTAARNDSATVRLSR